MQRHFGKIEALSDIGAVLRYSSEVCADQGVLRRSYHLTPQFDAPNSMRSAVYAHGYTPEWLEYYDQADFRQSDPIPERTMRHGAMLTWQEARYIAPNTPENEAYFKAMDEEGLVHGFGLPLFGPRGRDAFAGMDFGVPVSEVSSSNLGVVRSVAQAAHQRVCVILDRSEVVPELSEREREVLHWVVRGKSAGTIATILELSPDTVKTYTKRIYAKLETSDRVGATVKALKQGLVTL
ncbi:MAG: autoinducer binding domain-containing protein [Pseudomonadota bacterium]